MSFCFSMEQITEGMNRLERALSELPARASGLRRIRCDSPKRSAVCAPRRGRKVTGWLDVAERPGGPIRCPVGLVNGAEDGPRLSITAGVHGTGVRRAGSGGPLLPRPRSRRRCNGAVGFVFIVNVPGWEAAGDVRQPRWTGQNLNRIFPATRAAPSAS